MMKLSRSAWIAIAAVAAVPASVAVAKSWHDGPPWARMTPDARERLDEGRIAMAKAALKLTAEQEKLWTPVEEQVRANFQARQERRAEWDKKREERKADRESGKSGDKKNVDLAERFEKMSTRMTERAERMKAFVAAFKPFYASLSDEQKAVIRPLMHKLSPGFGKHGRRGHGWAHGGGWGPGGRHHGGGHHGMHERGDGPRQGMMMDDGNDTDTADVGPDSDSGATDNAAGTPSERPSE